MDETSLKVSMQKVLDLILTDIGSLRTGRATPSLVENIICPAYGGTQRLKVQELATISILDVQTIVIDPWDKSIIGDIKKGILEANIGLNPSVDGEVIRISLPPMTTEDREKYIKLLSQKMETGRVMIRQIRAEGMRNVKKKFEEKELSEDMRFDAEKRIQEITDEYIRKIEEVGEKKRQELLRI